MKLFIGLVKIAYHRYAYLYWVYKLNMSFDIDKRWIFDRIKYHYKQLE